MTGKGHYMLAKGLLLPVTAAVLAASALADSGQESRQAFRRAVYAGTAAERSAAIAAGLKNADSLIRRQSLWELFADDRAAALKAAEGMMDDPSADVGTLIAELGRAIADEPARVAYLKRLVRSSGLPAVRTAAVRVMGFPFHRNNVAPSQDPQNDHESLPVAKFDLPVDGWRLRCDRTGDAHLRDNPCFGADYDWKQDNEGPDKWLVASIGKYWETQGVGAYYDGIGWYRREFDLPALPPGGDSVELCFDSVDDEAWVWVNGVYVGQHAEGIPGCGKPFRFDAARELKWGAKNTITVRLNDMSDAGGIDKGIRVEVLKCH